MMRSLELDRSIRIGRFLAVHSQALHPGKSVC